MIHPKRFDFWMYQKPCEHFGIRATMQMEFSENGRCVSWDDYAALAAENERLKQPWVKILTESETWKALSEVARLTAENERLTAEVEWLRKADRLVCWNEAAQEWQVRHEAPKS